MSESKPRKTKSKRSSKVSKGEKTTKRSSKRAPKEEVDSFVPDVSEVVAASSAAAQPAPKKEKKSRKSEKTEKRSRKSTKTSEKPSEPSTRESRAPVSDEVLQPLMTINPQSVITSKRGSLTREEMEAYFDRFNQLLETELELTRADKNRRVGVRTWKSFLSETKRLRNAALKSMKKPKNPNKGGANSGFKKPCHISEEMADFAGWDPEEMKSRNDVTRLVCDYIKQNDLQNPEDRRQIIADEKLQRALGYDPNTEKPLTYPYLQVKFKNVFRD